MSMRVLARFVAACFVSCAALALWASAAHAQVGSSTDLIIGRVLGPDTLPLKHARVTVTSVESGISRNTSTNDDGRFTLVFPDGGGQYVVTAQFLGMYPERTMVRRNADEDRLVVDFHLAASPVVLQAMRIIAAELGDSTLASAGANGKVVSRELLDRLGYLNDDQAAIAMITPGVNLIPGSDSSLSAISVGGQAPAQTRTSVDGVAGRGNLPSGALKSAAAVTSEYDVSHGGYTGGYFNMTTISGTNKVLAHLNSYVPLAPIGQAPGDGVLLQRQTGGNVGGDVSGPLRKDHLFFAGAFNTSRMSTPTASAYSLDPAATMRLGVAPDSLARFLGILASHGLGAPAGGVLTRSRFTGQNEFVRIDFTPNEHNTLTLSGNSSDYESSGFNSPLSTANSSGSFINRDSRVFASLTSHAGAWVNDARVSASWDRSGIRAGAPTATGSVVVPSATASNGMTPAIEALNFGGFGGGNRITYSTDVEAKDEVSRLSSNGAHRVKAGVDVTLTHSTGGLPSNVYGYYSFNSLADLEAGTPASFTRTIASADRRSGVTDAAAYLGDAWRLGPQLQLVYGARVDQATFLDAPALNSAALTAFGLRTDHFPRDIGVSPRLGFTYQPGARQGKTPIATVRGGVGVFRSSGSNVAETFAGARDATGLTNAVAHLSCVGAAVPAIDWDAFVSPSASAPESCSGAASTGPAVPPSVTFIDPSFDVPRTVRASLSVERMFRKTWDVTVDASLTNGYSQVGTRDINLVAAPRFTIANEGDRPVYVNPGSIVPTTGAVALADSRIDPEFGVVGLASSSLRNRDRSMSIQVSHNAKKVGIMASYTHAWSRQEVYAMMPSAGGFFYGMPAATAGDPRVAQWVPSQWSPPHAVRVMVSYTPAEWVRISPSVYAQNPVRFDPRVAGDVNGDGANNDLAFIFDPAHTADTAVSNGMQRLIATAPSRVRDCLESQLGRLASPGSCSAPWFVNMSMSVQFTPSWQQKRLTLSVQTTNLLSGADMLLHGPEHLRGWGQFFGTDPNLLYVRGFDPTTRQFRYAVNQRFGEQRVNQTYMVRPFQLMLTARINVGSAGGPMMMMGGPPGAKGAAAGGGMSADTIHARLARTLPNPFRRTIALKDSLVLGLDSAQLAALKTKGDAFQPRVDSVITQLVTIMRAPLTGPNASDVATRVRSATDAGQALEKMAIADLKAILTEAQFSKLPPSVTKPGATAAPPPAATKPLTSKSPASKTSVSTP